jgi:hypothetical protein
LASQEVNTDKTPVVRSVSGAMSGPLLVGTAHLYVRVIRAGSNVTTIGVDLCNTGANDISASALVVLGTARASARDVGGPEWNFAPSADVAAVLQAGVPDGPDFNFAGLGPEFLSHLGAKPTQSFPGQHDPHATTMGWLRLINAEIEADATWLTALTDAWWTVALVGTDGTRPVATVSFHADLIADPSTLDPTTYLLHVGRAHGASEGYVAESRELWSPTGELVARCNQTVAVIR